MPRPSAVDRTLVRLRAGRRSVGPASTGREPGPRAGCAAPPLTWAPEHLVALTLKRTCKSRPQTITTSESRIRAQKIAILAISPKILDSRFSSKSLDSRARESRIENRDFTCVRKTLHLGDRHQNREFELKNSRFSSKVSILDSRPKVSILARENRESTIENFSSPCENQDF